jgi:hypothetical protein
MLRQFDGFGSAFSASANDSATASPRRLAHKRRKLSATAIAEPQDLAHHRHGDSVSAGLERPINFTFQHRGINLPVGSERCLQHRNHTVKMFVSH